MKLLKVLLLVERAAADCEDSQNAQAPALAPEVVNMEETWR